MSVISNNQLAGASGQGGSGYEIKRSLRFDLAASSKLTRTPSSAGNRKTWTLSFWIKRSKISDEQMVFSAAASSTNRFHMYFPDADTISVYDDGSWYMSTSALARDPSAWMHLVFACDTTQSTATDRFKTYINGVLADSYSTRVNPPQNRDTPVNSAILHQISGRGYNTADHFDGYLADVHLIDGQALAATDFGEYDDNNIWQPKKYSGSYGTNGSHLDFKDNSSNAALGNDAAGSNNWTVNNLEAGNAGATVSAATGALPILNTSGDYGGTATSGVRSDSNSSNIVLAVPLNGSNNGTTITDYHHTIKGSGSAKTVSIFTGDASGGAVTSTAQSKYYGSSFYTVRGATNDYDDSDYLYITGDTDLDFGTGDFCVEFWYHPSSFTQNSVLFDNRHPSTGWPNSSAGFQLFTNHNGELYFNTGSSGPSISSSGVLTVGKWSHIAITRSSGTVNVYHNGTSVGSTSNSSDFDEGRFTLGSAANNGEGSDGYYADLRIYKGAAKYTSNFTVPSEPDYSNSDSLIDTPTDVENSSGNNGGNYATLNPLNTGANLTLSDGNLRAAQNSGGNYGSSMSTIGVSSGKWYCEMTLVNEYFGFGVGTGDTNMGSWLGQTSTDWVWRKDGGGNAGRHNSSNITYSHSTSAGDVIGLMLDLSGSGSNGVLKYSVNGTDKGAMVSNIPIGPTYFITCGDDTSAGDADFHLNFGQRPFKYTPPSGYKSLCTTNLPDPTIADGSTAMDTTLYSGNDSQRNITGLGFSPDLVWIKKRSGTGNHSLMDTVRGATKNLVPNDTQSEGTETGYLNAFLSNGFSIGASGVVNDGSSTYAAWAWDAGTSTSSNTDGSITSSVRANASAGFSIVSYTGTGGTGTVGHGLNATPHLIIVKNRDESVNWVVAHNDLSSNRCLALNSTADDNTIGFTGLNKSNFTSSTFTVNYSDTNLTYVNASNDKYIAYCFAPVEGYSDFGSYTGNGSSDGPFVYTGFRPKYLLIKRTNSSKAWQVMDTERDPFNVAIRSLFPAGSEAETADSSSYNIDFLSNGFKIRTTHDSRNGSSDNYIYAAFAEHPFKTARAR